MTEVRILYDVPTDTEILDWLIANSATYTSQKVPLQLIAQEGHPVHRSSPDVGYRVHLKDALIMEMINQRRRVQAVRAKTAQDLASRVHGGGL